MTPRPAPKIIGTGSIIPLAALLIAGSTITLATLGSLGVFRSSAAVTVEQSLLPSPIELAAALARVGLTPESLTACGVQSGGATQVVTSARSHLDAQRFAELTQADDDWKIASATAERLGKLVRAGQGTGEDVTALRQAETALVAAEADRESLLDALRDAATAGLSQDQVGALARIEAKRSAVGAAPLRGELLASPDDRSILVLASAADLEHWRVLIEQFDQREAFETISYTPEVFAITEVAASLDRLLGGDEVVLRIVADELTGTLLITGTAAQHEQVRALLDRLATAPEATRRPTRTFRLKNRDAAEVLGVVQSLVSAGMLTQPEDANGQAQGQEGGIARTGLTPDSRATGLQLASDPATNAIIAIGESQELDRLAQLLDDLDVRRPQVLIEVLIISLSESDSFDLGIEIEKLVLGPNDTIGKLGSLFGLSSTGAGSSDIPDRGGGGTAIVLSPGDFSVVVRALKTINRGRSLSMPKVLVASNEQASINSVLETPFTTINASDTVATTSFGGSSNAGTEVSVTPQIAEGGHLRLEYQVSLSAFVGEAADSSVPPPKQQNSISSVATIPDGYTIAVGGIELVTEGEAVTGIPLLSDLPLLGEIFKNRSNSTSRSRFYVFIRPTILRDRDFEDLKYLSDLDVADAGIDDGWPVQAPRLIR